MNIKDKINILIIGAFDRYNYGDLLFPLVIESALKKRNLSANFHFYGLKKSDLSLYGGKKTNGIKTFYKDVKRLPNAIVIVAGGEAIGISWLKMFSFYNSCNNFISKFKKYFNVERYVKKYMGAATNLPFVFSKEMIGGNAVLLNSLGECGIKKIEVDNNPIFSCLSNVDYFSVRDKNTYAAFSSFNNVNLFPDSAVLISKFYDKQFLKEEVSSDVNRFVSENINYLFFQINNEIIKDNVEKYAELFDRVQNTLGLKICFCAIGRVSGHEDQYALKKIMKKMKTSVSFFENATIWDTMALIANAKFYLGSSLHGVITSMSFLVPYIGIGIPEGKVNSYIKTWGTDEDVCLNVDSDSFYGSIKAILNKENLSDRLQVRDFQLKKANESFDNMLSIIKEKTN